MAHTYEHNTWPSYSSDPPLEARSMLANVAKRYGLRDPDMMTAVSLLKGRRGGNPGALETVMDGRGSTEQLLGGLTILQCAEIEAYRLDYWSGGNTTEARKTLAGIGPDLAAAMIQPSDLTLLAAEALPRSERILVALRTLGMHTQSPAFYVPMPCLAESPKAQRIFSPENRPSARPVNEAYNNRRLPLTPSGDIHAVNMTLTKLKPLV